MSELTDEERQKKWQEHDDANENTHTCSDNYQGVEECPACTWDDGYNAMRDKMCAESGLTFKVLREANRKRLPTFRNKKGEQVHADETGREWSLSDWMCATAGEVGEAANIVKKVLRGDFTIDEARPELAKELADVALYLDLVANLAGIDLGKAVLEKFNEVSVRVGSPIFIKEDGSDWRRSVKR